MAPFYRGTVPAVGDDEAPASQLWLVRHGATAWSAAGKHTSSTDLDLVESGVEEARTVGPKIGGATFGRVLSSPRLRAEERSRWKRITKDYRSRPGPLRP